jgi:hypothetical protein
MSTSNITNWGHSITVDARLTQAQAVLSLLTTAGAERENYENLDFEVVMSTLWAVSELLDQAKQANNELEFAGSN